MSINSVTTRIKEIQSQISLVKPRVSRRFSTVLDSETETQTAAEKPAASDFTALSPIQNDTGSSILQALVKKLSDSNTADTTQTTSTQQFDPNCEECVAELAAKNGYVKASELQTQSVTQNGYAGASVSAAPAQTTADVQTTASTQTQSQPTQSSTQSVQTQNTANQTYTPSNPGVLTLEDQARMAAAQYTPSNPGVLTLEDQANMSTAQLVEYTGLSAEFFALNNVSAVQQSDADRFVLDPMGQNAIKTPVSAQSTTAVEQSAAAASAAQSTQTESISITLPLGYTCPVDYSVALPAEYSGAAPYMDIIKEASARYGMPVNLIVGIMKAESDFDNSCVSSSGAKGLMQLMPETAAEVGVTDVFDPRQNILGSVEYITKLINKYDGDVRLALAGYNTGPGNIQRQGVTNSANQNYTNVPESIRDYADRVLDYAGYIKNS